MRSVSTYRSMILLLLAVLLFSVDVERFRSVFASEWRRPVLEVFVEGDTQPSQNCRDSVVKDFGRRPGLTIVFHDVTTSEKGLARFRKLVNHFKSAESQFPAFYVCGHFETGWNAKSTLAHIEELLTVEVFTRQDCLRCGKAKTLLFQTLAARYPAYHFVEQDVVRDAHARQRLSKLSKRYQVQATSVPAVHFCGRLMVGFIDEQTSLQQWDAVLRAVTLPARDGEKAPDPFISKRVQRPSEVSLLDWPKSVAEATEPTTNPRPGDLQSIEPTVNDQSPDPGQGELLPELADELALPTIPETEAGASPEVVNVPFLGAVRWRDWAFPVFTFTLGMIDGFNPCAMWVLLFLLSMLVNLHDRWKILAVAGTFVVISGAAYYAFMAAWLSLFEVINLMRPAQITLACIGIIVGAIHIKDFFAFKKGFSLSIPESAKPGLYARVRTIVLTNSLWSAIAGASIIAVLVNIIELLCTAGLPAMYTNILSSRQLPWWQDHLYMLLYIAAYMLDDTLMVIGVVVTLNKYKLQERGGRILKLISGLVILVLGLFMLLKPEWLV